jgi:methylamine utilization protein MauE
MHDTMQETTVKDYLLFAGILLGILAISLLLAYLTGSFNTASFMRIFMGVFFLVFGVFKLLDLPGFVMSYIGYDIIAKKFTAYAYIYPFLELALALSYFLNVPYVNYATVLLVAVGSAGVTRELLRGSKIKCACLGTYIKLPLTTVSLIEDLVMGIMALVLIIRNF